MATTVKSNKLSITEVFVQKTVGEYVLADFLNELMLEISSLKYPADVMNMLYSLHAIYDGEGRKVYIAVDVAKIIDAICLHKMKIAESKIQRCDNRRIFFCQFFLNRLRRF